MNDRLAYLHTVVLHRCADVLTDADLASIEARSEPNDTLPRQIAEQILAVLEALEQRMDALTAIVRDHDDDGDRRRARQAGEGDLVGGR